MNEQQPHVLVLREHHGSRYFDVSTPEKLADIAISVVSGRFGPGGDYAHEIGTEPTRPDVGLTDDQLAAMPDDNRMKRYVLDLLKSHKHDHDFWKREKAERDAIDRFLQFVRDGDEAGAARLAWDILRVRESYEDEGFELIILETSYQ